MYNFYKEKDDDMMVSLRRPSFITFDSLCHILCLTVSDPLLAVACVLPFVFRHRDDFTKYTYLELSLLAYACFLILIRLLASLNTRLAYGPRRSVDIRDELVVIAGGAGGLGSWIAELFLERGAKVAVLDQRIEESKGAEVNQQHGDRIRFYACDVSKQDDVENASDRIMSDVRSSLFSHLSDNRPCCPQIPSFLFDMTFFISSFQVACYIFISSQFGSPTILIHSVATSINAEPLDKLSVPSFSQTISANLTSYFMFVRTFLPGLRSSPTGGFVVTVSSVLGHLTAAGFADYSATKAAISAAHKTLEAELRVSTSAATKGPVKTLLVESGQLTTPLFERIESPSTFFAPLVQPKLLAERIVMAVEEGRGGTLRMPVFASFVELYALMPATIQNIARWMSGIDMAVYSARKVSC